MTAHQNLERAHSEQTQALKQLLQETVNHKEHQSIPESLTRLHQEHQATLIQLT